MACTTNTSTAFPVQLQSKPTVTEKYYVAVKRCGKSGSFTFETTIHRKSDDAQIGGTTSSGVILLFQNVLNEKEKPKQNLIKRQVRQALNKAKKFPIGNNISHKERTSYLKQLGFQNVAQGFSSNPTGSGQYASNGVIYDASTNEPVNISKDGEEDPPTTFQFTNSIIEGSIEGRRFRKQYGHFAYPEDLRSNKQDRVKFTQKYTEGTIIDATISAGQKPFQRKVKKVRGSVTLPVVSGIEDTSSVKWDGTTLNPIQALAGAGAMGVFEQVRNSKKMSDGFNAGVGAIREIKNQLAEGTVGSDLASAINVYLAQSAVGAQGLLSRTTGAILNPNLEMLFGGPQLRSFAFSFSLSPRDADEADQVRKILRFFKQGMSVKTSSSNVFLKAPNIFDIQYQTFNTEGEEIVHPSINMIKTCALTSCNVRYTPNGTYMTYEDPYRTMQAYQVTMQFGELDPIYDSDYSELDKDRDQVIGY